MNLPTIENIKELVKTEEGIKALFDYMKNQKERVDSYKREVKDLDNIINKTF